jgi:hypothetical protein
LKEILLKNNRIIRHRGVMEIRIKHIFASELYGTAKPNLPTIEDLKYFAET